jgi:hypothetical protein
MGNAVNLAKRRICVLTSLTQMEDCEFTGPQSPRGSALRRSSVVSPMTSISYLHGRPGDTDASRFCREKARDCQRAALTTTDPSVRLMFLHLAKFWRETAEARSKKLEGLEDESVVIVFPKLCRSKSQQGNRA